MFRTPHTHTHHDDHYVVFYFYFHIISLFVLFQYLLFRLAAHFFFYWKRIILWMVWSRLNSRSCRMCVCVFVYFSLIIRIDVSFIFFTALHYHKMHTTCATVRSCLVEVYAFSSLIAARIYINFWSLYSNTICIWFRLNRNHNFFFFIISVFFLFFFFIPFFMCHSDELTLRKKDGNKTLFRIGEGWRLKRYKKIPEEKKRCSYFTHES